MRSGWLFSLQQSAGHLLLTDERASQEESSSSLLRLLWLQPRHDPLRRVPALRWHHSMYREQLQQLQSKDESYKGERGSYL